MNKDTLEKVASEKDKLKADAKDKVIAEKAAEKKAAEKAKVKAKAEAEARRELELAELEEKKQVKEVAKAKAVKVAKEAVAKAKKAKDEALKLQQLADKALADLDDSKIKGLVMKNEVSLTVAVPGHSEIRMLKKFVVGEKVTRTAFIQQIMGCGLAQYDLVE